MNILVIDIGGSHVKLMASEEPNALCFDSGTHLTPDGLVSHVRELTAGWKYDVVSLGYPGTVGSAGPTGPAGNLGDGWIGYDFSAALGRPVRVVNDAAMQAMGAYAGGRMLFLGLGTGLGSTLVAERVVIPVELGCLPYGPGETMAERLGKEGLERHGKAAWRAAVTEVTAVFRRAFVADYVVLGGGNAGQVERLPEGTILGGNQDAFTGGFRLWEEWVEPHDRAAERVWRVVE